jgi:hypothetical protein
MSVCVSILALVNPVSNAHAPYYITMCGLSGCNIIFAHYLVTGTIFRKKKKLDIKYVL